MPFSISFVSCGQGNFNSYCVLNTPSNHFVQHFFKKCRSEGSFSMQHHPVNFISNYMHTNYLIRSSISVMEIFSAYFKCVKVNRRCGMIWQMGFNEGYISISSILLLYQKIYLLICSTILHDSIFLSIGMFIERCKKCSVITRQLCPLIKNSVSSGNDRRQRSITPRISHKISFLESFLLFAIFTDMMTLDSNYFD